MSSVFGGNSPFKAKSVFGTKTGGGDEPTPAYRQPLDPDEYKGIGQKALDAGVSGISAVAGALDKPGQAVRGLIDGKGVSSLKHLVPFSHAMGLTTDADSTSGRDLTDHYGLTQKGDQSWGAWGKGLAADIVTDPLTYASFGAKSALTPIGKAVEKTGALKGFTGQQMLKGFHATEPGILSAGGTASDVNHAINQGRNIATGAAAATGVKANQPLGSLVRVGLPFGGPGVNIGTGQTAQKIAGGLDAAGDWVKFGNPAGRAVGSLFDSTRGGAVGKATQIGAQKYLTPALEAGKAQARADRFGLIKQLDPLVSAPGASERAVNDATRAATEGVTRAHAFDPALNAAVQPAAAHASAVHARQLDEVTRAGGPISDVNDQYVNYFHRSAFPESQGSVQLGGSGGKPVNFLPNTSGANIGRDELFRDIPGGTARINDWFDRFAGLKGSGQKARTTAAVGNDMVSDLKRTVGLPGFTPEVHAAFDAKAAAYAKRLRASDPKYRSVAATANTDAVQGQPFFSPDAVSDFTQRGNQHVKTVANTKAAIGILGDVAVPHDPRMGTIKLSDAMKKLGLTTTPADQATGAAMQGALPQMYQALAKKGFGKVDPYLMGKNATIRRAVDTMGISPDHFAELTKAHAGWSAPEEIKSSLGALDSVTNAFKGLAYPIWIPSHVRNAWTALVNNLRHGVGWNEYAEQAGLMTGRGTRDLSHIHPSLAGLNPAEQATKLRELQYAHGNIYGGHGMNEEIAGNVRDAFDHSQRYTPQIPGSDRAGAHGNLAADTADLVLKQGLAGSIKATAKTGLNVAKDPLAFAPWNLGSGRASAAFQPLGIKGVGGAAHDALPAVQAGRKAGTNIEDFFRGALFNKMAKGGSSGQVAGDAVNKLHFDYDALTGFEKNVMRRVMPFYTYARKNLPLQVDTALHTPGVLQAQTKPFNQPKPGAAQYVPTYLNSGVAIPIGNEQDGKQQFVSKLGLPAEEAFEKLHFQNGLPDVGRTAMSYMGGMNPLVKAPLEQLFNTQFHTGRKLSDLKAPGTASAIGGLFGEDNPQLLGQIMSNSPLTRFFSSADKIGDPRKSWAQKALNLGTGVKVTDVDMDKQRAIDTRQAFQGIMDRHPNFSQFTSFRVKPEDAAKLTPEEIELMRGYTQQQGMAREYMKRKKAADALAQQRIGVQNQ